MTLKSDPKLEEELTCGLENDMRNMANFHQSTWKFQNWDFDGVLFLIQRKKCMRLKFTEELYVMAMKNDAKFEEELICRFKIEMRNLTNFWPEHLKVSKSFALMGSFWIKRKLFQLKKYRGVIFHNIETWDKNWRGIDSSFQNTTRNLTNFDQSTWKSHKLSP